MKIEINGDVLETLSVNEVAGQLVGNNLPLGEKMGEAYLDCRTLVVPILYDDPHDPRIYGCRKENMTFDIMDIRRAFSQGEYYVWAKDEDGDDVLACFMY